MDKVELIQRINKCIAELSFIRQELLDDFPEYLHKMTMHQLLLNKGASVRLLNCFKQTEYGDISVSTFLNEVKAIDVLKFRNFGKITLIELRKIIKDETGFDW